MQALSPAIRSMLALVAVIVLVHLLYAGHIRPEAEQRMEQAASNGQSAPRDLIVIVKDYEQEICFILMLWGCFLILQQSRGALKNRYLFNVDLIVNTPPDTGQHGIDIPATLKRLDEEIPADCRATPLVLTLRMALLRYQSTGNVQNLSDAVSSSMESLAIQHESDNSMIRYLIWAIPSIGFIGTVRGIGQALSQADAALAGDIAGMTNSLGVAFNSTLVALLISIFLMYLYHQLQRLQDSEIIDTQAYCDRYLLWRIR